MNSRLLRIETNCWLDIQVDKLSSRIGCGEVLSKIPRFHSSDAFHRVLSGYQIRNIYADNPAQKILRSEKTVGNFCKNALAGTSLNENFRNSFRNYNLILLLDRQKESGWILGDVNNRLPFLNYYREVVPVILNDSNIVLTGSLTRLLPIGWQNFYDVLEMEILKNHPEVKIIEILSIITDARWRKPILGIGINLLNLTTPHTIYNRLLLILSYVSK